MRWLLPLLICTGCKWVYDAQYDERADELEKFRSVFQPGTDQVKFLTASEHKLYWIDLVKPLDETMLHSIVPSTGQKVDYELTRGQSDIDQNYRMSDQILVRCGFGSALAFDATQPNTQIDMTTQSSDVCTVDGRDVYFDINRKIMKWTPGASAPVQVADLDAQMVGTESVGGMGVIGHQLVLEEGGRLWLIDLTSGQATWLENPPVGNGTIAFDATGVVFESQQSVTRELFADHSTVSVTDLIADGGYEINFEHADAQEIGDFIEVWIAGSSLVYRGKHGLFAYNFTTKKVVDLLLDRGDGFDATALYHSPVVVDGVLFTHDTSSLSAAGQPVYQVQLNGRL